jgi:hypothetical protein
MNENKKYALLFMSRDITQRKIKQFYDLKKLPSGAIDLFCIGYHEDKVCGAYSRDDLEGLEYSWMHSDLMPGHVAFVPMLWFLRNISYDGIFLVEDDVKINGSWIFLIDSIINSKADFVTTLLRPYSSDREWSHWKRLSFPSQYKIDNSEWYASFNPFFYLSRNALLSLDEVYRAGAIGHYEAIFPTYLKNKGYSVIDLKDIPHVKGSNRPWYSLETFRHRPLHRSFLLRRNMLYHPCKGNYLFFKNLTESIALKLKLFFRYVAAPLARYRSRLQRKP